MSNAKWDQLCLGWLQAANQDQEAADEMGRKELKNNRKLREQAIDWALWNGLRVAESSLRALALKRPPPNPDAGIPTEERLARRTSILDYPLPFVRIPLRDAQVEDLEKSAGYLEGLAKTHNRDARWLRKIARQLKGDKSVGDAMAEEQIEALRDDS